MNYDPLTNTYILADGQRVTLEEIRNLSWWRDRRKRLDDEDPIQRAIDAREARRLMGCE